MLARNRQDMPREKMISKGASALGDNELMAVLLGTGSREENVLQVADKITTGFDLREIAEQSVEELSRLKGIGRTKACRLLAGFELGRRLASDIPERYRVVNKMSALRLALPVLRGQKEEKLVILTLSRNNTLIKKHIFTTEQTDEVRIDSTSLLRRVIRDGAYSFIILHNHPSGDPVPSEPDIRFTDRTAKSARTLGVTLLDHLVIADEEHFSFREAGLLK
jgi:DNA repair protein RadC